MRFRDYITDARKGWHKSKPPESGPLEKIRAEVAKQEQIIYLSKEGMKRSKDAETKNTLQKRMAKAEQDLKKAQAERDKLKK
jgi:predicted translin family RNA/ssDNA-binding protein